eukprot:12907618-Prorocentrum_lima.AAC.1
MAGARGQRLPGATARASVVSSGSVVRAGPHGRAAGRRPRRELRQALVVRLLPLLGCALRRSRSTFVGRR